MIPAHLKPFTEGLIPRLSRILSEKDFLRPRGGVVERGDFCACKSFRRGCACRGGNSENLLHPMTYSVTMFV